MNNKIVKRDPFRDLDKFERRVLSDFFSPMTLENTMPSHLTEDENNYYLLVELPGMNRDNIKVEAGDKYLHIHGERKEEKHEASAYRHYSELSHGSFNREYHFNTAFDKEQITANYRSGILKLTIPKVAQSKLKQVKIAAEE